MEGAGQGWSEQLGLEAVISVHTFPGMDSSGGFSSGHLV